MIFGLMRRSQRRLRRACLNRKSLATLHLRRALTAAARLWHGPCLSLVPTHGGARRRRRGKGGPMKASHLIASVATIVLAWSGAARAQSYLAPSVASAGYGYAGGYGEGYG